METIMMNKMIDCLLSCTNSTSTAIATRYDWPGEIPVTEWLAGSQQEVMTVVVCVVLLTFILEV